MDIMRKLFSFIGDYKHTRKINMLTTYESQVLMFAFNSSTKGINIFDVKEQEAYASKGRWTLFVI